MFNFNSSSFVALFTPTEDPEFEGLTKTGYFNFCFTISTISSMLNSFSSNLSSMYMYFYLFSYFLIYIYLAWLIPAFSKTIFVYTLSIPTLEAKTLQPT